MSHSPYPDRLNLASERHRLTLGDYPPGPLGFAASSPPPRPEINLPERFHFQPPRGVHPGLPRGPRKVGAADEFIQPPSLVPLGPRIPLFLQNRPVTTRASQPDLSIRSKRDEWRTSQPLQFQSPLQPLIFDQIPYHRHTLGGSDGYLWVDRQLDTSLPANLNQPFVPLILDYDPQFYTTQSPPRVTSFVDPGFYTSLPLHMSRAQAVPFTYDRHVDARASFPLQTTRGPQLDPNLSFRQDPRHLDHTRPFEPLSQTIGQRIPQYSIETIPEATGRTFLHRSYSDPSFLDRRRAFGTYPASSLRRDRSVPSNLHRLQRPLMFDRIPDRRHTLGGTDNYYLVNQQQDTSLPLNLNQMRPFMIDRIPDRRHTLGGSDNYHRVKRQLDSSLPTHLQQRRPLMLDRMPDRRHTLEGSGNYRRVHQQLDSSLPANLNAMRPLLFDQIPDHRHTLGGSDGNLWIDRQLDRSLPAKLNHVFPPLILDYDPQFYISQPIPPVTSFVDRGHYTSLPLHMSRAQHPGPLQPLSQSLTRRIPASPVVGAGQRTHLPTAIDHLRRKLAEAETSLQIEQLTVNELRSQIDEESRRYEEEISRAKQLAEELEHYKLHIADLEEKNVKLVTAIELEKNRYAYMMKMKNATPEMLAERETNIRYEQEVAEKLVNEVQTEKVINDELAEQLNEEKKNTAVKRRALQNIIDDKARLQAKVDEMVIELDHYVQIQREMSDKLRSMEDTDRSRSRRLRAAATRSREALVQSLNDTSALERENSMLKVQLKQSELQLQALASETPLKLKLNEANNTMQKLVAEKEHLFSQFSHLKEQKDMLNNTLTSLKEENDELRKRLTGSPKIMVTDGCMEDVNAKYASERAAWLKEKEALQNALARATRSCPVSMSEFNADLHHVLSRYMRAESYRKSLAWQKQYLLLALAGYKEEERDTIKNLRKFVEPRQIFEEPSVHINKFKVTALAIIGIARMHYLVEHRRNTRQSTYDILHKALTKSRNQLPHNPQTNSVWHRQEKQPLTNRQPLLTPLTPGCVSEYMERFNEMQNRIRLTLGSNNT